MFIFICFRIQTQNVLTSIINKWVKWSYFRARLRENKGQKYKISRAASLWNQIRSSGIPFINRLKATYILSLSLAVFHDQGQIETHIRYPHTSAAASLPQEPPSCFNKELLCRMANKYSHDMFKSWDGHWMTHMANSICVFFFLSQKPLHMCVT